MVSYFAYGLRVQADAPIPGFLPDAGDGPADVEFSFRRAPAHLRLEVSTPRWQRTDTATDSPSVQLRACASGAYLAVLYRDGSEFFISTNGRRVWASWPDSLSLNDVLPYIRGPILGAVLRLRHVVSLHASAIAVDDQAIAFVGPPGAGKSTTAAAFAQRGVSVLSDDIVPLEECNDVFWAQPGYPTVCLWPSSVEGLYGRADALPLMMARWEKRRLDLQGDGFSRQPLPLSAIYLLDARRADIAAPAIESVHGYRSLHVLLANTFGTYLSDESMRVRDFSVLGRVAARVPIRRVTSQASLARLPELCDAILKDAACLR